MSFAASRCFSPPLARPILTASPLYFRFLDIAAGAKELHLSNAFSHIVDRVGSSVHGGEQAASSTATNLGSSSPTPGADDKRHVGANIPVERSQGGV